MSFSTRLSFVPSRSAVGDDGGVPAGCVALLVSLCKLSRVAQVSDGSLSNVAIASVEHFPDESAGASAMWNVKIMPVL